MTESDRNNATIEGEIEERRYFDTTQSATQKKKRLISERTIAMVLRADCKRRALLRSAFMAVLEQSNAVSNTRQPPVQGDFRIFCASASYRRDFAFLCFITAAHLYTDVYVRSCTKRRTYARFYRF